MKFPIFLAVLMMALSVNSNAQDAERMTESCTSIMVGKLASTDGSVITSHTCDARYRTWMTMTPARDYDRDTVTAVYRNRIPASTRNSWPWAKQPSVDATPCRTRPASS